MIDLLFDYSNIIFLGSRANELLSWYKGQQENVKMVKYYNKIMHYVALVRFGEEELWIKVSSDFLSPECRECVAFIISTNACL